MFLVRTIAGHTFIQGGAGDDRVLVGNAALLDDIRAILVLDGGAGADYVLADDSAETDNSLGTLTQTTLTGLDMTATSALDRLYSVTAGGAAFSITLAGYGTVALAGGASAAAVQAALQNLLFPATRAGRQTGASARRASSSGRPATTTSSGSRASSSPARSPHSRPP